jgi:hypothetical protein
MDWKEIWPIIWPILREGLIAILVAILALLGYDKAVPSRYFRAQLKSKQVKED